MIVTNAVIAKLVITVSPTIFLRTMPPLEQAEGPGRSS